MNVPTRANVADVTRDALVGLAMNDPQLVLEGLELHADWQEKSGLDPRISPGSRSPPSSHSMRRRLHTCGR
jgi:hypothetical protein